MNLQNAILWAAELHAGQFRDGESPLPYLVHPLEVLSNLRNIGGVTDEALLCAAVLHDVREECGVTDEQVRSRFGGTVAGLVAEVTRYEPTASELRGLSPGQVWAKRSDILLAEISRMSPGAQSIKLADRLSNFSEALRTRKGPRLKRYRLQSKEILRTIPRTANPALWEALAKAVKTRSKS